MDKTGYIRRLLDDDGPHYFLSRPRRFGKSLFVDTLKELFEGNEALFRGLAVDDGWDWSKRHPVVRLDFSNGNFKRPGVLDGERAAVQIEDDRPGGPASTTPGVSPSVRFRRLIEALSEQAGRRVVVLVDEYDKPILDALDEPEIARTNRDDLRGLYGTIKACDAHVELTFITGVSKFSKVSLFSDLNNLTDLTLDPAYSAICGYTEADLDAVFAPELPGLDRDEIRAWYNGYSWLRGGGGLQSLRPAQAVPQPRVRGALVRDRHAEVPGRHADPARLHSPGPGGRVHADASALLSSFDVDHMAPEALLFQTGYLTVVEVETNGGPARYRLGYPNREVRRGLNGSLLDSLAPNWRRAADGGALRRLLAARGLDGPGGTVAYAAGGHPP